MSDSKHQTILPGTCYLVGAGPGDPGLLTVKGAECLRKAEVLVYDALANPELLQLAPADCERINAGKRAKKHKLTQDETNALLVKKCIEGKTVVRLKGGDPMIFGRGGEEAQELQKAGISFEIVPGISSSIAGPIYAGIPVTHRSCNTELTIFTGHEDPTKEESSIDYPRLASGKGTLVMLMGVSRLRIITGELAQHGASPDLPVALVRWATTGRQETVTGTISTIADVVEKAGFKSPAVCVIGHVVSLRDELRWFDNRPLFGKRVVVTRTRKQAGALSVQLRQLGADALELPTIRIEPAKDQPALRAAVEDAHHYDWIVFTSPNGVEHYFDKFYEVFSDARSIGGTRIAAVGPGTAKKLLEYRFATDLLPAGNFVAEGLIEAFQKETSVEHLRILWVRAEEARPELAEFFQREGAILDEAIVYRTVPETSDVTGAARILEDEGADVITFTSASTVDHFMDMGIPLTEDVRIASIGPVTSEAVRSHGMTVDIEAKEHNIPGLVAAVRELLEG